MIQLEKLDPRIPDWDMANLSNRKCPFCDSSNEPILRRPDLLPVAFCNTCGCWYVSQMPSALELKKFYDGYYYTHRRTDLSEDAAPIILKNAHASGQADWQLQVLSKALGGISGKRIFDVGCGIGRLLLAAKTKGADVSGCDLSPEACKFASNSLGLNVYQSSFSNCRSSIGIVDAVIMKDFIEHPVDPLNDLRTAISILKKDGLLLLHTPNGGEAGKKIDSAKEWVGFRVDLEHLQYLTPHLINWLAETHALRIERLNPFGYPRLRELDASPKKSSETVGRIKNVMKSIPHLHKLVHALRAIRSGLNAEYQDPLFGSYHLWALLRKI